VAKMLNPQKFWGPLSSSEAPLSSHREFFSEEYATNSCETYILHAMLCTGPKTIYADGDDICYLHTKI
jgi:hypothetical protein